MTTLDVLLRRSADSPTPSREFVPRVLQRISRLHERRCLLTFLGSTLALGAMVLIFSYTFSYLLVDALLGSGSDLLRGFIEDPSLLLLSESWLALSESPLALNTLLLIMAAGILGVVLWKFLRALHIPSLFLHVS